MVDVGISLLLVVVVVVIFMVFLQWWKGQRHGELVRLIADLVAAAEKVYGSGAGATKLAWVEERLKQRFPQVDLSLALILIEAAIYRQDTAAKPTKTPPSVPARSLNGFDHR